MPDDFRPVAQITCEFRFEASHLLRRDDWSDAENDAVFGNCARLHGHSYRLCVTLRGPIDGETGMVMNFTDLKRLGLLGETLVICGGEFGRTPAVELVGGKPGLGRDHNHWGFSVWLAGAGVKGGMTYGSTDEFGFRAAENPVHVHDLHATLLHLLGFDHERLTYRYAGRDFRLTDVYGRVVRDILA